MAASGSDLRLVPAAVTSWAGALAGTAGAATIEAPAGAALPVPAVLAGLVVVAGALALATCRVDGCARRRLALIGVVALVAGLGAFGAALGRVAALGAGPVIALGADRAHVDVTLRVTSDPLARDTSDAPAWRRGEVRLTARLVQVHRTYDPRSPPASVAAPAVVLAPAPWQRLRIGDEVVASGRLSLPSRPGPAAVVLRTSDPPHVVGRAATPYAWGDSPRAALRASVAGFDEAAGGLLPSLVVGDESLLPATLREQLRVTGLAHLTAVSGANVAIVLGAVLLVVRWLGVRGRGLTIAGLLAIAGFVLLTRPEPSVVRASAMGAVVVLGLASGRRRRGIAPLALAVCVLLLADPWLARSLGFALSVSATAALVTVARPWARAAARWLPWPVAAALAVPLAAQLACTPLLVAMSGEVSLSAVPANLLAAPAVAPATVLGVGAAVLGVAAPGLAHLLAGLAMVPTGWIVLVAEHGASLPGTTVPWVWGVPAAVAVSAAVGLLLPTVLRSPWPSLVAAGCLTMLLLRPADGWPPDDWAIVACDVGQGDALVLRATANAAVVVDTGPDPALIDGCLDDLGVTTVPLVVLTHFHTDHVGGVEGLTRGRTVDAAIVTSLDEPAEGVGLVDAWADEHHVPVARAVPGDSGAVGDVGWVVIWPERHLRGDGSPPNQASVVLRADVRGLSVLLTGDIEPAAQRTIAASHGASLDVAVLKVPHHGSPDQHSHFLQLTHPAVALVSVGVDNVHGHPDDELLAELRSRGVVVARTDTDGDIAVTHGPAGTHVVRRGTW